MQGTTARHSHPTLGSGPGKRVSVVPSDKVNPARLRTEKNSGALSPLHATRLAEALRQPETEAPSDTPASNAAGQRLIRWLEQSGLSADLRTQIAAYANDQTAGVTAEFLRVGSPFDQWLRGQLDEDSVAAWDSLLAEHRGDVVERRANHLLVGLQDAVALSHDQKDAIYPKLTEWVSDEMEQSFIGGQSDPNAREEWLASRYRDLTAMLPADQHGAVADWLAEFLPTYWDVEANKK